jgi:hypothetical protein
VSPLPVVFRLSRRTYFSLIGFLRFLYIAVGEHHYLRAGVEEKSAGNVRLADPQLEYALLCVNQSRKRHSMALTLRERFDSREELLMQVGVSKFEIIDETDQRFLAVAGFIELHTEFHGPTVTTIQHVCCTSTVVACQGVRLSDQGLCVSRWHAEDQGEGGGRAIGEGTQAAGAGAAAELVEQAERGIAQQAHWSCLTSVSAGEYYGDLLVSGSNELGEEAGERGVRRPPSRRAERPFPEAQEVEPGGGEEMAELDLRLAPVARAAQAATAEAASERALDPGTERICLAESSG